MERAWVEVMAGDTADRPARQEIDASGDTDHTHLHLFMTLSFWPLSLGPSISAQTAKYFSDTDKQLWLCNYGIN